jgi:hypothetical protein
VPASSPPAASRSFWIGVISGAVILTIGIGARQSFGIFQKPIAADLHVGRELWSFATALAMLLMGAFSPFAGAASHCGNGNSRPIIRGSRGKKILSLLIAVSATSATTPSMISLGGGSRTAETSPINSGATATMPGTLEVSQRYQIVRGGAVEPSTNMTPSSLSDLGG